MLSLDIRQLRDTTRLRAWLEAGQSVELRDHNRVLGRIVAQSTGTEPGEWPDFARRAKKIFGERVVAGSDLVIQERGR